MKTRKPKYRQGQQLCTGTILAVLRVGKNHSGDLYSVSLSCCGSVNEVVGSTLAIREHVAVAKGGDYQCRNCWIHRDKRGALPRHFPAPVGSHAWAHKLMNRGIGHG